VVPLLPVAMLTAVDPPDEEWRRSMVEKSSRSTRSRAQKVAVNAVAGAGGALAV
jgi:cell division protein FtsL